MADLSYRLAVPTGVWRLPDNTFIPEDMENYDWVAYQAWLAEGHSPLPAEGGV